MAVNGIEELNGEIFSDNLVGLGDEGGSLESSQLGRNEDQDCNICDNKLCNPRVLSCLHVFCETCIEKLFINEAGDSLKFDRTLVCPSCKQETKVGSPGVTSLPPDYILTNILDVSSSDHSVVCTCCKSKERAVARCADCSHFLCPNCNSAHQFMRCFENHRVILFESEDAAVVHKPVFCRTHSSESLLYYCHTCEESVCQECTARAHKAGPAHQCERVAEAEPALRRQLTSLARRAAARADDCQRAVERFDETLADLQRQREEAQSLIRDSYRSYSAMLEATRDRAEKQLERLHSERELKVMDLFDTADRTIQKIERACKFTDRLLRQGDATEIALLKRSAGGQILNLVANVPDFDVTYSLEFQTDFVKFESAIDECFGRFKTESSVAEAAAESVVALRTPSLASSPPALPVAVQSSFEDFSGAPASPLATALPHLTTIGEYNLQQLASLAGKETPPPHVSPVPSAFILADLLAGDLTTTHAYNNLHALAKLGLSADISEMNGVSGPNSNRDGLMALPATPSPRPSGGSLSQDEGAGPFPRAAGKAAPMHIRFKFGQLGGGKGQFNSPHGFCLGNEEDIVVADTNNHRITVFEKTGTYKFHFGTAGKDEGQLWYPRKVAVMRATGKFVVCDRGNERSRMQIFTKNGHFLKKIAVRYIDIVAGLAVTQQGHIVAVDSVTPTVFVISENGDLLSWFDCSECMREPSDIAINGKEFYVCDFKGHCVVVFSEDGKFLRRIGQENVTNFPNGIDVSDAGDVLIGDSHGNKFHVAVFTREGTLLTEFECPYVKVSRCCGLKITSEGYIVTLAKNNHHVLVLNTLYIV